MCAFCADKTVQIDYKEVNRLRRYLSERAKIEPRRKTGTCAGHQRELSVALKRARRVSVGPQVTMVFENRATMIMQVEEMCRAESITTPEKIQEEIDVYNQILPDDGKDKK